jgi:voltage-gated sodium channel
VTEQRETGRIARLFFPEKWMNQSTQAWTMRQRLGVWIESGRVQNFIIGVIILNAVTLGMETSPWIMQRTGGVLLMIEYAVLAIFITEIGLKLFAFGWRFFRDPWNVFDFLIVSISVMPAAGPLTVLRTLRILRALRLLKTIPRLRWIVEGVLRILPDMAWVFSLLTLVFYVFAVMATKLYGPTFPEEFGSIGRSLFTLFQVMTLESWASLIARPVMAAHPHAYIFFVSFVLTASFLILNMVIGVVVNGLQGVMQGAEHPPGIPPQPVHQPPMDLEAELAELHRKLDLLLEERAVRERNSEGRGEPE